MKRFPRTNTPVYFRAYIQTLSAARRIPTRLSVITNVKNFLRSYVSERTRKHVEEYQPVAIKPKFKLNPSTDSSLGRYFLIF